VIGWVPSSNSYGPRLELMAHRFHYDTSPAQRDTALRADEVEALILNGGAVFAKDQTALVHLLHRVAATLRDQRERLARLQADVDRIRSDRADARLPMTRAMEALNELNVDEQRQLLDRRFVAEVEKLRDAQQRTELEQAAARNEVNRVRLILAELLNDPAVDPGTRQRVINAEQRLSRVAR
jgi:hypothetical protein